MTVLSVDVVCDNDTTGTVRGYFTRQKQSGKSVLSRKGTAGKKMRYDLSYRAGKKLYAAVSGGRQRF